MTRTKIKKEFKKPIRMCIALEEDYWEYVKQLAIHMSVKEKRVITPTEIMRSAITERYPMPQNNSLETKIEDICKAG